MKPIHKMSIGLVVLVIVFGLLTNNVFDRISDVEREYKQQVGETVIIEGDTLTITDYSILMKNFTLSDGRKVSYEFVIEE